MIVAVLVGLAFGDGRWLLSIALAFQVALLTDARTRNSRAAIFTTTAGALVNILYVIASTFGYIPDIGDVMLTTYGNHTLYGSDVVVNVLGSPLLLMLRNGYRKHQSLKRALDCVYTCTTHRYRVALRPVSTTTTTNVAPRPSVARRLTSNNIQQLQLVRVRRLFDERDIVLPRARRWSTLQPSVLRFSDTMSLVASVSTLCVPSHVALWLSLDGAGVVLFTNFALVHRQLLRCLYSSFALLFVAFQAAIAPTFSGGTTLALVRSWPRGCCFTGF